MIPSSNTLFSIWKSSFSYLERRAIKVLQHFTTHIYINEAVRIFKEEKIKSLIGLKCGKVGFSKDATNFRTDRILFLNKLMTPCGLAYIY